MSTNQARTVRVGLAAVVVVGMLTGVLLFLAPSGVGVSAAQPAAPGAAGGFGGVGALARLGVTPAALAAGGGSAAEVADALALLTTKNADLDAAAALDRAEADAHQSARDRARDAWLGGASADRRASLAAARSNLELARAAADQARRALADPVRELLAARLGADGLAAMDRVRANSGRDVPMRFRALTLGEPSWRTLESACAKSARGGALDTAEAALLARCESHPQAVLTKSRLDAATPAIEAAFSDAIVPARTA